MLESGGGKPCASRQKFFHRKQSLPQTPAPCRAEGEKRREGGNRPPAMPPRLCGKSARKIDIDSSAGKGTYVRVSIRTANDSKSERT